MKGIIAVTVQSHAEGSDLEQEYYDDGYLGVQIKHYPKILLLNMTQNNLIEGVLKNLCI